jgi:hypothetical protein
MNLHSHHPQNLKSRTNLSVCMLFSDNVPTVYNMQCYMRNEIMNEWIYKRLLEGVVWISAFVWIEETHNINTNIHSSTHIWAASCLFTCTTHPSSYTHCCNAYLNQHSAWYAKLSTILFWEIKLHNLSPPTPLYLLKYATFKPMTVVASTEYRTSNISWQLWIK